MKLVLTVIGQDRPGLVDALAQAAMNHGANWEASHMARLVGRFAGILSISVDDEKAEALEADLHALGEQGLRVMIERSEAEDPREGYRMDRIELVGHDRPGIIREISSALAERGINLDELETEVEAAPMAGGTLFKLSALLRSPPEVTHEQLEELLEKLHHELMIDISLET